LNVVDTNEAETDNDSSQDAQTAEMRLMQTTQSGLMKQFLDILQQYFAIQDNHQQQYRSIVEQQIKIGIFSYFFLSKNDTNESESFLVN
jgi:uncharacterized protein YwqG